MFNKLTESSPILQKLASSKKILYSVMVAVVAVGLFLTVQQIQRQQELRKGAFGGGVKLSLTSAKTQFAVGEEADISVILDTVGSQTWQVTAADVTIKIPTNFEIAKRVDGTNNITIADSLPTQIVPPPVLPQPILADPGYVINQAAGTVRFVVGSSPTRPATGLGTVAIIRVKAVQPTTTQTSFTFDPATAVSAKTQSVNVVDTLTPLPVTVLAGGGGTPGKVDLSLTSANQSYPATQTFTVDVVANANGQQATAADLYFTYPVASLQLVSVAAAGSMPVELRAPTIQSGTASIMVGSNTNTPLTTTGIIAKLTFKGLVATVTPAQVQIVTASTRVSTMESGTNNALGTTTPISFTFTTAPTSTPTPIVTIKPTATPLPPTATPIVTVTVTTVPTATVTISPNSTRVTVSLKIPGIGVNTGVGENNNLQNPIRPIVVTVYNTAGTQLHKTITSNVTYNTSTGRFGGTVVLYDPGSVLPSGNVIFKVKIPTSLTGQLTGQFTLVAGQNFTPSALTLIHGDITGDNVLDLYDYNILLTCWGARSSSPLCGNKKAAADLNDNGQVIDEDFGLLMSGFADVQGVTFN